MRVNQWSGDLAPIAKHISKFLIDQGYMPLARPVAKLSIPTPHHSKTGTCLCVVKGSIEVTVGTNIFSMNVGDHLTIPPQTGFSVLVTSENNAYYLEGQKV